MFWGLIMEPKRRYTQVVKRPFHVAMAALDIFSSTEEPCQVMLNFENRNYLLCTLQKEKDVQCMLDLNFETGDKVVFATNGNSNVHLTGYLADESDLFEEQEEEGEEEAEDFVVGDKKRKLRKAQDLPPKKKSKTEQLLDEADNYDSDDDESFSLSKLGQEDSDADSSEEDEDAEAEEDDEDMDEEDEDSDDEEAADEEMSSLSEEEEEEHEKPKVNGVPSKKKQQEGQKKPKVVEAKAKSPNKTPKVEKVLAEKPSKGDKGSKTPKGEKTPKSNKTPKTDAKQDAGNAKSPKQQANSPQKRVVEGGLIIQDMKVGDGQVAKPGKMIEVYYEGRLKQNNKLFDKIHQGPGFKFRLGKQEVIRGWEVGFSGMKVGGKRRLVIPPNMGYGAKGSPPEIPPNSTLVFDVELRGIK